MKTDELIAALALDTRPVGSGEPLRRLILAVAAGAAMVVLLIALALGDPLHGAASAGPLVFGVKLGFTGSLVLLGLRLLLSAARPGHDPRGALAWVAAPFVLLALVAMLALSQAPAEARAALIFGSTWAMCLTTVSLLSVPVFGFLVWAQRRLAPTDLKLAGGLAGLLSGSTAALVYALHCPESSPAFMLLWYGLAIAFAAFAGRLVGPRLLRW